MYMIIILLLPALGAAIPLSSITSAPSLSASNDSFPGLTIQLEVGDAEFTKAVNSSLPNGQAVDGHRRPNTVLLQDLGGSGLSNSSSEVFGSTSQQTSTSNLSVATAPMLNSSFLLNGIVTWRSEDTKFAFKGTLVDAGPNDTINLVFAMVSLKSALRRSGAWPYPLDHDADYLSYFGAARSRLSIHTEGNERISAQTLADGLNEFAPSLEDLRGKSLVGTFDYTKPGSTASFLASSLQIDKPPLSAWETTIDQYKITGNFFPEPMDFRSTQLVANEVYARCGQAPHEVLNPTEAHTLQNENVKLQIFLWSLPDDVAFTCLDLLHVMTAMIHAIDATQRASSGFSGLWTEITVPYPGDEDGAILISFIPLTGVFDAPATNLTGTNLTVTA